MQDLISFQLEAWFQMRTRNAFKRTHSIWILLLLVLWGSLSSETQRVALHLRFTHIHYQSNIWNKSFLSFVRLPRYIKVGESGWILIYSRSNSTIHAPATTATVKQKQNRRWRWKNSNKQRRNKKIKSTFQTRLQLEWTSHLFICHHVDETRTQCYFEHMNVVSASHTSFSEQSAIILLSISVFIVCLYFIFISIQLSRCSFCQTMMSILRTLK